VISYRAKSKGFDLTICFTQSCDLGEKSISLQPSSIISVENLRVSPRCWTPVCLAVLPSFLPATVLLFGSRWGRTSRSALAQVPYERHYRVPLLPKVCDAKKRSSGKGWSVWHRGIYWSTIRWKRSQFIRNRWLRRRLSACRRARRPSVRGNLRRLDIGAPAANRISPGMTDLGLPIPLAPVHCPYCRQETSTLSRTG
jgi:hypothetical protein